MALGKKILWAMILVIALSFAASLAVAFRTASEQDAVYNVQRLERKERAIERSLEYVVDGASSDSLTPERLALLLNDRICELAEIHDLTLSVYNLDGLKLTSSNASGTRYRVPPAVLQQVVNTPADMSRESAGMDIDFGEFVEAFWRFEDALGKPLAVVGVKYEKRQVEGADFLTFLSQLAPVYLGLFVLTLGLAYFLAQTITRPIRHLTASMAHLDPTHAQMQPLKYQAGDDIGKLVSAYNTLQAELAEKVAELGRRERESAWRLMAMQVAHEIKNPLTPLRLGLQQLIRAWQDGREDFGMRLSRFNRTAEAQIDVLNTIASDFALLAELNPELGTSQSTDVVGMLEEVVAFWADAHPQVNWKLSTNGLRDVHVRGKRTHLVRVLNNLLSNAQHAVMEGAGDEKGFVVVSCQTENTRPHPPTVQILITDSGPGIRQEEREQIFEPRFTTKSAGTGMGLAMVQAIVKQFGGTVRLLDEGAEGAVFELRLPLMREK